MQITLDKHNVDMSIPYTVQICQQCFAITLFVYIDDNKCEIHIDAYDRDSSLIRIYVNGILEALCHTIDESYNVDVIRNEIKEPNMLRQCLEAVKNYTNGLAERA